MLDPLSIRLVKPYLDRAARAFLNRSVSPNQISIAGFFIGIGAAAAITKQAYLLGLVLILINRLADGLDGALARLKGATDRGAYLDITLDFIFYSAIVMAFALEDPRQNSLAAAGLLFSFVGTGSSFLAFAIIAERREITDLRLPGKGFYYLGGLAEGTETILFFTLFCLFPGAFPTLAGIFTVLCLITTLLRIIYGYKAFRL